MIIHLLKRWCAVPAAIAWLPLYLSLVPYGVAVLLFWMLTGKSFAETLGRYVTWVMVGYWDDFSKWLRK